MVPSGFIVNPATGEVPGVSIAFPPTPTVTGVEPLIVSLVNTDAVVPPTGDGIAE